MLIMDDNDIFKGGHQVRHKDTLDIDLVILNVQYRTDKYIKLKILYFNRNWNGFVDLRPQIVTIKAEDQPRWSLVGRHAY
jgi:hypothetical protein